MKKFTKVALIIAGSAFVLGLAFAICGLSMAFQSNWAIGEEYNNTQTLIDEKNMQPFDTIDVSVSMSNITFVESDSYSVQLISSADASELDFSNENGKLTISFNDVRYKNYDDLLSIRASMIDIIQLIKGVDDVSLTIGIPAGVKLDNVNISTDFGSINALDLSANDITATSNAGKISLRSTNAHNLNVVATSGSVELDDVEVERELAIECNLGQVRLNTITADAITVTSNSGSIAISEITANSGTFNSYLGSTKIRNGQLGTAIIEVGSGSTDLSDMDINELLDIKANSGSVTVELRKSRNNYSYDLTSDLGSVRVDGDDTDLHYKKENGSTPLIRVVKRSGSVRVNFIG